MSNLAIGEKYPLVDHKLKEQEERHCEENGKQFAELASQLEMKNSEISQLKKKGQSVAKYNTELESKFENLKQEINDLRSENKMLHQENKELRIGRDRPKQLEPDNVDGRPSEVCTQPETCNCSRSTANFFIFRFSSRFQRMRPERLMAVLGQIDN